MKSINLYQKHLFYLYENQTSSSFQMNDILKSYFFSKFKEINALMIKCENYSLTDWEIAVLEMFFILIDFPFSSRHKN